MAAVRGAPDEPVPPTSVLRGRAVDASRLTQAITVGLGTIAGGDAGVLAVLDPSGNWAVEAATPGGTEISAGDLRRIGSQLREEEAIAVRLERSGRAETAVAIGLASDPPRMLLALGVEDPERTRKLAALYSLAELATAALHLAASHAEADVVRSRAASLVAAGMVLSANLDLEDLLTRLVETARQVFDARYSALGVLNADRTGLDSFVAAGIDQTTRAAIGGLPSGRGVLGRLLVDHHPIRIDSIADHPSAVGFPPGHPTMTTFLGVPIRVGTEIFGNLYVADKRSGPFTEEDEFVALTLAAQAAVAIANARRYGEKERVALAAAQGRERAAEDGLRRAIEAQESERARIARELHDETGQDLTALTLQLKALDDHVTGEDGKARLAAARQALSRTASSLREMALELRPSGLKEHGLASAIERRASRLGETTGISVAVALDALPDNLPEPVEIALFRVVQEALTNIARHSEATHASISASLRGGRLRLVVEDDGRGFDPSEETERLGLVGIRERMELLGGDLFIESARRAGTTVIIELEVPHG